MLQFYVRRVLMINWSMVASAKNRPSRFQNHEGLCPNQPYASTCCGGYSARDCGKARRPA